MLNKKPKINKDNYKKVVKIILGIIVVVFLFFFIKGGIPLKHYFIDLRDFEINEAFPIDTAIINANYSNETIRVRSSLTPWKEDITNVITIIKIYANKDCDWNYINSFGSPTGRDIKKGQIMIHTAEITKDELNLSKTPEVMSLRVIAQSDGRYMGGSKCVNINVPEYMEGMEKINKYLEESNLQQLNNYIESSNLESVTEGLNSLLDNGGIKLNEIGVIKENLIQGRDIIGVIWYVGTLKINGGNLSENYLELLRHDTSLEKWLDLKEAFSECSLYDNCKVLTGIFNNEEIYTGVLMNFGDGSGSIIKVRINLTEEELRKEVEMLEKSLDKTVKGNKINNIVLRIDSNSYSKIGYDIISNLEISRDYTVILSIEEIHEDEWLNENEN